MRMRRSVVAPLVVVLASLSSVAVAAHAQQTYRSYTTSSPGPASGALFTGSHVGGTHFCSGVVVHSAGHDLVATAAHCITGTGTGLEFVPGYDHGKAPYGAWKVTAAFVDVTWKAKQDPAHDVAFLRVAPQNGHNVEYRTGALTLGAAPKAKTSVALSGYVAGSSDGELRCTAPTSTTGGYPTIGCRGFDDGTSGSPWRSGATLVGVTGGLHQGGCDPDVSYSAPFGHATQALWWRAEHTTKGDVVTPAGDDGC